MKLAVIVGTVRENRQTAKMALWINNHAQKKDGIESTVLDLKDYPMPFFAEPASPRYNPNRTIDPIAKKWLDALAAADAYIFVTPEYNHSIPGVLKNALDYLDWQLVRKPATVAAHGVVGGARATMHLKEIISESKAVAIPSALAVHGMSDMIDEEGNLSAEAQAQAYGPQTSLDALLEELTWYSDALATARAQG